MLAGWKEDKANSKSTEDLLDLYIKLYNDCISKRPKDMHVGLHICRGELVRLLRHCTSFTHILKVTLSIHATSPKVDTTGLL